MNPSIASQLLGVSSGSERSLQTFVTVDFFNHDTKYTDVANGFKPQFDTIFSFKNNVDDFYLKYLTTDFIIVEIFAVITGSSSRTEKIGEAKLPLTDVLDKNTGVLA